MIEIPLWFLISLCLILISVIGIFSYALNDWNECMGNPMVYGAEKAEDAETGQIMCSCSFSNPSYQPFYFDSKGMSLYRENLG